MGMLRKRQRSHQTDLHMGNNMITHLASESYKGQRLKTSSLFGTHGPSLGYYSSKTISYPHSVIRSPISPPDFKKVLILSNPFSFSSSVYQNGPHQVGLGLINSFGEVFESSKSTKNIVFGPQLKLNIPTSSTHFTYSSNSSLGINPLPRDNMVCPNLGGSNVVYGLGEASMDSMSIGHKICSCLSHHSSPLSNLKIFHSEHKHTEVVSPPLIGGCSSSENSSVFGHKLLPESNGIGQAIPAFLLSTPVEIELSEEYTRVTFNGPKPKVTRFFGDSILGCLPINKKKEAVSSVSNPVANGMNGSTFYPFDEEFLNFCYTCKKKLENWDDIYIYRGETSFCSNECRFEEILADHKRRLIVKKNSSKSSPTSSNNGVIFLVDQTPIAE